MLCAYAAVVLAMVPLHEPWRDEAQAWLIARDLGVAEIIRQSAAEGSPCLWQLVLAPFAKLGLPYFSENLIHAVLACATLALFLFAAPFARWQKLAFAASYYMAFEYSVVARSYVMSVMFLLALAALDRRRHERPIIYGLLIVALANTNLHSLTIAAVLAACFALEEARARRSGFAWIALFAMAAGGGLALWQLGDRVWRAYAITPAEPAWILNSIRYAFYPTETESQVYRITSFAILAVVIWSLRRNWRALVVLCAPLLGWALTPMVYYTLAFRHTGLIMMLVVFALWISWEPTPESEPAAAGRDEASGARWTRLLASGGLAGLLVFGTLALSAVQSVYALRSDAGGRFSSAKAMAGYLRREGIAGPIAAFRSPHASALLPYLPGRRLWYVDGAKWGTFVHWDREVTQSSQLSDAEVVARVREEFGDDLPLLLTNRALEEPERLGYRLQHASTKLARVARGRERYFLYEPLGAQRE